MKELAFSILQHLGFEADLIEEILSIGRYKGVKAGKEVPNLDSLGREVPFVLEGLLKVMRHDEKGREVFLYYLEKGETCAMSLTCCLEGHDPEYKLVAERDAKLWMIPTAHLDSWVVRYPSFRRFMFLSYHTRFDELMTTIDSVVFSNMDDRLYKYLLDTKQATGSFAINKTHEQIARDLDTSRVVISRLMKQLEREGKIEQSRNLIEVL